MPIPADSTEIAPSAPAEREITVRNVVIAMVCMLGFTLGMSMFGTLLGVTMIPMTKEFHWSRAAYSLASTFMTWSGALVAPFAGRVIDHVGVKPIVISGTMITGVTAMALSRQTSSLTAFYVAFAVIGLCTPLVIGYSKVIASMFTRNRGKMLAIFGVEGTVVGALTIWLIGQIYAHLGWRALYVSMGVAMLSLLPALFFVLREPGSTLAVALRPEAPTPPVAPTMAGKTLSQIVRTQPLWVILAVAVIIGGPSAGTSPHIIPFLIQKGFPVTVAVSFISAALLLGFVGALVAGWLLDRFHTAKIAAPCYVVMALGMAGVAVVSPSFGGLPLMYVSAALMGGAANAASPMNTYFHTRFFGLRAFTEVVGLERTVVAVASGVAAPLVGYVYDQTHSYNSIFTFMIFPPLVAAALYLFIGRYHYPADIGSVVDRPLEQIEASAGPTETVISATGTVK